MSTTSATAPKAAASAWAIRAEQPIDIDQIHDLHRSAFLTAAEAELVDAIRSGPDFVPELSIVAVTGDGTVLGHALASRVGYRANGDATRPLDALASRIGYRPNGDATRRLDGLALGPVAVLPAWQRQGIGSALVRAVVTAADARDEPFIAVSGDAPLFAQFGFRLARGVDTAGLPLRARGLAIRVGRGASPVLGGTVVYPAAFRVL